MLGPARSHPDPSTWIAARTASNGESMAQPSAASTPPRSATAHAAMGSAVHSLLEAGRVYATLDVKVNFVRPIMADSGDLVCTGEAIHVGRRVGTAEGRIVDRSNRVLAHGTTTVLIMALK